MSVSSDFKDLLNLFNVYHIKYLIIGGYAVIRATSGFDRRDFTLSGRACSQAAGRR